MACSRKLNTDELRKLQLLELDILKKFIEICEKYNLVYFLAFGSTLGAVRHKGFIPWDDDIDVGMPRTDYDKFCKVAQSEFGNKYFWQTYETDKNYFFFFGKVRLNGTTYKEMTFDHIDINHGIYIDIFPFEGAPSNKCSRFFHRKISEILRGLIAKKWGKPVKKRKPVFSFLSFIWRSIIKNTIPASLINYLWKWNAYRYSADTSPQYVVLSFGYEKESYNRNWIIPTCKIKFEGENFCCPNNYHEYLKRLYGKYMQIPQPNERYFHPVSELNFGKYIYFHNKSSEIKNG